MDYLKAWLTLRRLQKLPVPSAADLAKLGEAPGKGGMTAAGHSLTKHGAGARPGNTLFPQAAGNQVKINALAQNVLNDILNDPNRIVKRRITRKNDVILQVSRADGSGVVYKWNGTTWIFWYFGEGLY